MDPREGFVNTTDAALNWALPLPCTPTPTGSTLATCISALPGAQLLKRTGGAYWLPSRTRKEKGSFLPCWPLSATAGRSGSATLTAGTSLIRSPEVQSLRQELSRVLGLGTGVMLSLPSGASGAMARPVDTWMRETTEPCSPHKNVPGMRFPSHRKQVPPASSSSFIHPINQSINQQAPVTCQALFVSGQRESNRRDKTPCPQAAPIPVGPSSSVGARPGFQRNGSGFFLTENWLL